MKRTMMNGAIVLALVMLMAGAPAKAASIADIVLVVDESASMSTEHAWISGMLTSLNTALGNAGVTANYALIGFASGGQGRTLAGIGTLAATQAATANLLTNGGPTEDGYAAMTYAFNNLTFTSGAALNVILITDEDRDTSTAGLGLNNANMLTAFQSRNALLNAVVNNAFSCATAGALGVDSDNVGYVPNGTGGYSSCNNATVGSGAGNTASTYVPLALATGGAAWNLNQLRQNNANLSASFTQAFVEIKVREITTQGDVPEPATMALAGGALLGLALLRRKRA